MKKLEGKIEYSDKKFQRNAKQADFDVVYETTPCRKIEGPGDNMIRGSPLDLIPWPKKTKEVAELLIQGRSACEIGEELGIHRSTVYRLKVKFKNALRGAGGDSKPNYATASKQQRIIKEGETMKAKMNKGHVVKELRKKMGLTQEQLAEILGISSRSLRSIEKDETDISLWNFITILEMSGNNTDDFWLAYIHSEDYQDYLKLREIKKLLRNRKNEEAREVVLKFEADGLVKNSYIKQFVNIVKIATDTSLSLSQVIDACQEILQISKPGFDFKAQSLDFLDLHFNYNEIITICLMADKLFELGQKDYAIHIMEVITSKDVTLYCTQEDKSAIHPATLFTYSNMLGKEGRYEECLKVCLEGIELCQEHNNLRLIPNFLYNMACAYENLSKPVEKIKETVLEAYYSARALRQYHTARLIKQEAEVKFNISL